MRDVSIRDFIRELWRFFVANAWASYFGAFLLGIFLITEVVTVPFVSRYDFIFLSAIAFQVCVLLFRLEKPKEFFVIVLFHMLATGMELFKTDPTVGSWTYPGTGDALFVLATVPLFSGFLYSAVGSYISRAFTFLKLSFTNFPPYYHLWILSGLIYINFFTHHYFFDIRYALFAYVFILFYRTHIEYQVYVKVRRMHFLLAAFLTAFFVWIAENIGTLTNIWLYPNQLDGWELVPIGKLGSWFLLLILSFALVSIIYRDKLKHYRRGHNVYL